MSEFDQLIGKNEPQNDTAFLPVNINDVKSFLRIDESSSEEDSLLLSLVKFAQNLVEQHTGTILTSQTYKMYLPYFPSHPLKFPVSKVSSITSIQYYDENNALQTLSSSVYELDNKRKINTLVLVDGESWPDEYNRANSVIVTYVAGYASATVIPETLKHAIKVIVGNLYEKRVSTNGQVFNPIIKALLEPYRSLR